MVSDELNNRVNRIYAALEGVEEKDLAKFPPKIADEHGILHVWQDFLGDVRGAQLSNAAHSLIHNIAHLEDHLRKWAGRHESSKLDKIDQAFKCGALAIRILKDLSNNDKHGYPPRDRGYSGVLPRIAQIRRVLRLTTRPEQGSSVGVVFTPQGPKQIGGSGTTQVVITGDIEDENGNRVGDLHELASEAVEAIEALLRDLGIQLPSPTTQPT